MPSSIDIGKKSGKTCFVSDKPKKSRRATGRPTQFFLDPAIFIRFKGACAFSDEEMTAVVERLMTEFADKLGIPSQIPSPPSKRRRK